MLLKNKTNDDLKFFRIEGGAFDNVMNSKTPFMYKVYNLDDFHSRLLVERTDQ